MKAPFKVGTVPRAVISKDDELLGTMSRGGYARIFSDFETAFSSVLDLSSPSIRMAKHAITGPLNFTIEPNPVAGSSITAILRADGVNTPTFSGALPMNGSAEYANVQGQLNTIDFYFDGTIVWYSIVNNLNAFDVDGVYDIVNAGLEYVTDEGSNIYAGTASAGSNAGKIIITRYRAKNTAAILEVSNPADVRSAPAFGFDANAGQSLVLGNCDKSIQITSVGQVRIGINGAPVDVSGLIVAPSATTKYRLYVDTTGNFTFKYSTDDGATWISAGDMGGPINTDLYAHYYCTYSAGNPYRLVYPKQAGLVPIP